MKRLLALFCLLPSILIAQEQAKRFWIFNEITFSGNRMIVSENSTLKNDIGFGIGAHHFFKIRPGSEVLFGVEYNLTRVQVNDISNGTYEMLDGHSKTISVDLSIGYRKFIDEKERLFLEVFGLGGRSSIRYDGIYNFYGKGLNSLIHEEGSVSLYNHYNAAFKIGLGYVRNIKNVDLMIKTNFHYGVAKNRFVSLSLALRLFPLDQ